jgi:putative endonuclease
MQFDGLKAKAAHLLRGDTAEQQAYQYLIKKGLQSVTRNYRCKYGELDLIMLDQQALVIVEVRFRKNNQFGGALESVTLRKQSRIIAATQHYLATNPTNRSIRFDVVAITGNNIEWITNAFQT